MGVSFNERWAQGIILRWLNDVINELRIGFSRADQEVQLRTLSGVVRYPDIVIFNSSDRVACLIELKRPTISAYDEEFVEDALRKATDAGIPFFATWNINKLVLWETFRPGTTLLERRLLHENVLDIKDLRHLTRSDVERTVKSFLVQFLKTLWVYYEVKIAKPKPLETFVLPKLSPDEILVHYLRTAVDSLYIPLSNELIIRKEQDQKFLNELAEWFVNQGWIFQDSEEDYDRVSRQAIYLLINKILFYSILKEKLGLRDIDVSSIVTGEQLKDTLQRFFSYGIRINPRYGIICATDFLEKIPIPDVIVEDIKRLINELNKYDFSELGYDIVGKIFEKLIPKTERHKLGQYFTPTDIVDLILSFTIKHPDDTILDPACGSGTFLIRAYQRKKYLAQKLYMEKKYPKPVKSHQDLIKEIYGIDIAKFPAHLALINLMKEDITSLESVPVIACKDFFDVRPSTLVSLYDLAFPLPEIGSVDLKAEFPKDFKVIITNPPYTRQEEMEDIFLGGYKDRLRELVKNIQGIKVSKRSSIYVYFFLHGASFLAKEGRMGLITSNSWLDVDFGKHLQEFFLKNFRIIAVIESKVERWFEDADINTAITILEKCSDEKIRNSNFVKFVYLKKRLRDFLIVDGSEKERWETIDKLVEFIENCDKNERLSSHIKKIEFLGKTLLIYEDDNVRITMVSQADLWAEGWNEEEKRYEGSKWGKYMRAPEIFFKILEKGKDLFVSLSKIAEVRRGFTTGANEFFYLTQEQIERHGIEREFWMHPVSREEWSKIKEYIPEEDVWLDKDGAYFKKSQYVTQYKLEDVLVNGSVVWIPNYVIKSPKECKSIIINPRDLRYRVLIIHKDKKELLGTNVLKYIEWGEEQGFHKKPTCAARQKWYELSPVKGDLLCMMSLNDRHIFWINKGCYFDARLYGITMRKPGISIEFLCAFLNSSITSIFIELWGRLNLGQGALDVKVYEYAQIPVIDISKIQEFEQAEIIKSLMELSQRKTGPIFVEINAKSPSDVKLENIKTDRYKLDEYFARNIIGLSNEEFINLYKAIIDLVKTRLEKARTVGKKEKKKVVNLENLVNSIIKRLTNPIKKFPEDYLENESHFNTWSTEIKIPRGKITLGSDLSGFHVQVGDEKIYSSWNEKEVKFVYYAALTGTSLVKIPLDKNILEKALEKFEKDYEKLKKEISDLLLTTIPDAKIRLKVEDLVWKKIFSKSNLIE